MEKQISQEEQEFFEALDSLAKKEKNDSDFELMRRAVGSLWQNISVSEGENAITDSE